MSYVSKRFRTFRKPIARRTPMINITVKPTNPAALSDVVLKALREYNNGVA